MKKLGLCIGGVILVLAEGPTVSAADFVIGTGQTVTTTQSLSFGQTGVVEAGGAIQTPTGEAIFGGSNTTITNRGVISTSGFDSEGVFAGQNATVTNSGTTTTTGNNSFGIFASLNSTTTNSGTITTTGTNSLGILAQGNSRITNIGLISTSGADSSGIAGATINNSGIIVTTGLRSSGIIVSNSTVINTGFIGASGESGDGVFGFSSAAILNYGTITSSKDKGIDLEFDLVGSTVTNAGLISGNPAILFGSGQDRLNILPGARFQGALDFSNGGNDQVDIQWKNEVSSLWNFDGFDTGSGDSISVNTPNPYVVTNSAVSILDPTGFASAATSLAELTSSLHGTVHRHLRPTGLVKIIPQQAQQPIQVASTTSMVPIPPQSSAWNFWLQGFGSKTKREKERETLGYDHQSWGVIGGGTLSPSSSVRVGLFGGLADSKTDVDEDAQTLDALTGFGGIFGQFELETWFLQSSFAGGITSTDSHRLVLNNLAGNGSQRANADYTSGFISTAMTGGVHVRELLDGISLRPSVSLAYAAEWIPDYQESGSSADLTVDDRVVQILTGHVEMAVLLAHFNNRLRQEIRGGGFGRDQLGSKNVRVILLNQPLSFDPNTEDSIFGGFGGYGVAYDLMNTVTISADYAAQFSKDIFSQNVRLGLAIGF